MKDLKIIRKFNAPIEKLWDAWTVPKIAKKWWGPVGFTSPSIKIDLKLGGKYIFAMKGPKDSKWDKVMYSAGEYKEIITYQKLVVTDYFSDEKGNLIDPVKFGMDPDFPKVSLVEVHFEDLKNNKSKLTIIYPSLKNKEEQVAIKNSKMNEGWNSSLDKLQNLFETK